MVNDESKHDDHAPDAPPSIGFARVVNAWRYSLSGLAGAWRTEGAFRQEVIGAAILIPIACSHPGADPAPRAAHRERADGDRGGAAQLRDGSGDRPHIAHRYPLSKKAKDTGSAAVLVSIVIAMLVWAGVLFPFVGG